MHTKRDHEPLDEEILAGIMDGYLRQAVAQQRRFLSAGETPPITEESAHNRFLWVRIKYPAFFRHVAREMAIPRYNDRIKELVTAVATTALQDRPTLAGWAQSLSGGPRYSDVGKRQQRAMRDYLPDVIQSQTDANLGDLRLKKLTTSFDPVAGGGLPEPAFLIDRDRWKLSPVTKFASLHDWLAVSGLLHCTYPEQLKIWLDVAKAVRDSVKHLGATESEAARTITHPLAINVLANHAASIEASAWWIDRSPARQAELLETPRVFEYDNEAAVAAGELWVELARLDSRWAQFGQPLLADAGLALGRWGAAGAAGVLLQTASNMPGLASAERGGMLANAGYSFRTAGRFLEAVAVYDQALPLVDGAKQQYLRVITRVNLAEVLGGPNASKRASDLLKAGLAIAGTEERSLAGFWRNCATMFHRLGDEVREEAALDGLMPYLTPETAANAHARLFELNQSAGRRRPITPLAALER